MEPFINRLDRRINVGVEVTGYRPVSLDAILELIGGKQNGN